MNILIKLTCLVGLVIAPILGDHSSEISEYNDLKNIEKNVVLEINEENPNESSLTIVTRSGANGLLTVNTEKF